LKFAALPGVVEQFRVFGYPTWFMTCIGVVEFVGCIGLVIPLTATVAALLLGVEMVGAAYTHLMAGQYSMAPVPFILLIALCGVGYARRAEFRRLVRIIRDLLDSITHFHITPHTQAH